MAPDMAPGLAHALARARGPLPLPADRPAPPGMLRLASAASGVSAVPVWPDGVTPALLEEYQVAPVSVERAGEARRVLAACLKCCWTDLEADPWPGVAAPVELVLAAYRALIGRNDDLMRNWAIGALRRLHDSAWIVMSGDEVRLGPRCATWRPESHGQLRELVRRLPAADPSALLPMPPAEAGASSASAAGDADGAGWDEDLLGPYDERRRAEVVAAFMAVEHAAEPVQEVRFAALRDPRCGVRSARCWPGAAVR
ncbi:hypothetical protein [Thermocatellispora tengchongensis]|uniref:hypothetical protein n=1 Tax=Thermocatellispora tengchongensis TaxID=1073253 RepID=UPI0036391A66